MQQRLIRTGVPFGGALMALLAASTVQAGGVGLVTTAKTLPPATIAVIDPESGTSSGGSAGTDVRIAVGDIILFRFRYFPVPQQQIQGLNAWLTEYVPPNLQVVGVRLIDEGGLTVQPNLPGLAENGTAVGANNWNSTPCTSGGAGLPCPPADGGIAQVYQDTGIFYSIDPRTARVPSNALITLLNGNIVSPNPAVLNNDSNLRAALGVAAPFRAHNTWDEDQAELFGQNGGNTPHLFGSPVAGPNTHYRYEATRVGGVLRLNYVTGPWNRIRYPGSLIATGGAATSREGSGAGRYVSDVSTTGFDVTPNNPLPHVLDGDAASANAMRLAIGDVRGGDPVFAEVAFRVMGTPLEPAPGFNGDINCGESWGGDIAGTPGGADADNNPWALFVPSPACVFLNLLFDITANELVNDNSAAFDDIQFNIRARNLSLNTRNNVWIRQKYNPQRVGPSDDPLLPAYPDRAPTCSLADCDGDGDTCLFWNIGTMTPSQELNIRTNFEVANGGDPTTPVRADFSNTGFGTISGNPCLTSGAIIPGFRTQETVQIRSLGVLSATLQSDTPSVGSPGTGTLSGTLNVGGTQGLTIDDVWLNLPASGWRVANSGGTATPDITVSGVRYECSADCATSTPRFDAVNLATAAGQTRPITFQVTVPGGTPSANYPIDLRVIHSQSGYGGEREYYFNDIAFVSVGRPRTAAPEVQCPVLSNWDSIPGTTVGADGTIIRVYFNGILRSQDTATAGAFDADNGPTGTGFWHGPAGTFGNLYGGLEVRATAQAPGQNESPLSGACFVSQVSQCADGLDNDSDGLIDFPADPGCSSLSDSSEVDSQCNDGIDNDGDGDIDYPADRECNSPTDNTEGGPPACSDTQDNDGDGLVDLLDPDCTSPTDRTEVTLRACSDGRNNADGDLVFDFPNDPGCHSANDDDETDFAYAPDDIRARILFVFDTSGSMNWNSCTDDFTGGDGSNACPGNVDSCPPGCLAANCTNGLADDSRIYQARAGLTDVVAGFGEVEYGLMRFNQRMRGFSCPTANASEGSGGWQGGGAAPCGGGFDGGDVLVGFSPENEYDLLEWMDNSTNYPGGNPPAGLDWELRGSGTTPIAGSLSDALTYLTDVEGADPAASCRPYRVILITDGAETCGGNPVASAAALEAAGYTTYVIGFATDEPTLDQIALAGGGRTTAIRADDAATLSAAVAQIVNESILNEVCDGDDNDCDGLTDEGFTLYCNVPGGVTDPTLCVDPGETVCDDIDDNCDGDLFVPGQTNACGTCGVIPDDDCDGVDDDCDGPIDEDGPIAGNPPRLCGECVFQPETCDGVDNDCDGDADEGLTRGCGTDVGVCSAGTQTCVEIPDVGTGGGTGPGTWGTCTGTTPQVETCNGLDDNCDGVIDGMTRPCGIDTGACTFGTELCAAVPGSGVETWSGVCVGGVGPTTELCNAVDDDCNGTVDDGNPGGGATCGGGTVNTPPSICRTGNLVCTGGALTCTGGTGPLGAELCNGADEDCDGRVDEEIPPGAACGACGDGLMRCVGGAMTCTGDRTPTDETCNGLDDNCNGVVDEGNPGGGVTCGSNVGRCDPGLTRCVGGAIDCEDEVGPRDELCDLVDDDCDGLIDEGNPGGGAACGDTDLGECDFGSETCEDGMIVCIGATGPSEERCDGLDNNCNGMVDEGDPGGGGACGEDTGECQSGVRECSGGTLICRGGIGPVDEVCNGLDDDCDGIIDDGIDVGAPCGTDVGECVPGIQICQDGELICDGEVGPSPEVCNILDDDCNGRVDDDLTLGGECGMTEGACIPGRLQCITGREVCVGEVPAGNEVCDCEDNDCDGAIDEDPDLGSLCPGTSVCLDCSCALPCADSEFGRCPPGRMIEETAAGCFCVAPRCNPETCGASTVEVGGETVCAPDTEGVPSCVCNMGRCTFPCEGVVCGDSLVCNPDTGACVEDNCRGVGCPGTQICDVTVPECLDDPCETAGCADDEVCRRGTCEPSCATVTCDTGEICVAGVCGEDLCALVDCEAGEVCDPSDGTCAEDLCVDVECPSGSECRPLTGTCRPDRCTFVRCPEGQLCEAGECELEPIVEPDAGTPPEEDAGTVVERDSGTPPEMDAGTPFEDPEDRVLAAGGCMCRSAGTPAGSPAAPWLALGTLALVVWRRRRKS